MSSVNPNFRGDDVPGNFEPGENNQKIKDNPHKKLSITPTPLPTSSSNNLKRRVGTRSDGGGKVAALTQLFEPQKPSSSGASSSYDVRRGRGSESNRSDKIDTSQVISKETSKVLETTIPDEPKTLKLDDLQEKWDACKKEMKIPVLYIKKEGDTKVFEVRSKRDLKYVLSENPQVAYVHNEDELLKEMSDMRISTSSEEALRKFLSFSKSNQEESKKAEQFISLKNISSEMKPKENAILKENKEPLYRLRYDSNNPNNYQVECFTLDSETQRYPDKKDVIKKMGSYSKDERMPDGQTQNFTYRYDPVQIVNFLSDKRLSETSLVSLRRLFSCANKLAKKRKSIFNSQSKKNFDELQSNIEKIRASVDKEKIDTELMANLLALVDSREPHKSDEKLLEKIFSFANQYSTISKSSLTDAEGSLSSAEKRIQNAKQRIRDKEAQIQSLRENDNDVSDQEKKTTLKKELTEEQDRLKNELSILDDSKAQFKKFKNNQERFRATLETLSEEFPNHFEIISEKINSMSNDSQKLGNNSSNKKKLLIVLKITINNLLREASSTTETPKTNRIKIKDPKEVTEKPFEYKINTDNKKFIKMSEDLNKSIRKAFTPHLIPTMEGSIQNFEKEILHTSKTLDLESLKKQVKEYSEKLTKILSELEQNDDNKDIEMNKKQKDYFIDELKNIAILSSLLEFEFLNKNREEKTEIDTSKVSKDIKLIPSFLVGDKPLLSNLSGFNRYLVNLSRFDGQIEQLAQSDLSWLRTQYLDLRTDLETNISDHDLKTLKEKIKTIFSQQEKQKEKFVHEYKKHITTLKDIGFTDRSKLLETGDIEKLISDQLTNHEMTCSESDIDILEDVGYYFKDAVELQNKEVSKLTELEKKENWTDFQKYLLPAMATDFVFRNNPKIYIPRLVYYALPFYHQLMTTNEDFRKHEIEKYEQSKIGLENHSEVLLKEPKKSIIKDRSKNPKADLTASNAPPISSSTNPTGTVTYDPNADPTTSNFPPISSG